MMHARRWRGRSQGLQSHSHVMLGVPAIPDTLTDAVTFCTGGAPAGGHTQASDFTTGRAAR
jgi:hypothetical protein